MRRGRDLVRMGRDDPADGRDPLEGPVAGKLDFFGVAVRYILISSKVRSPAPPMGQYYHEVFGGWRGLTDGELERLKDEESSKRFPEPLQDVAWGHQPRHGLESRRR